MKLFRAKSNFALAILLITSVMGVLIIEKYKIEVKTNAYDKKIQAAQTTKRACEYIKNYRLSKGIFIDNINDPNETAMIGQEFSPITTERGFIDAKLTATNPNIAALIVQFMLDAGVQEGDNIAITMSGSFPVLNIAVIAACEALKVNPIIISSSSASSFGATDPNFTWLDMETLLTKANIIRHKSLAASIGGGADIGRGISPEGRNLIIESIERNQVSFINGSSLDDNIDKRMELFNNYSGKKGIKLFINVGSGIASIGNPSNHDLIPSGLNLKIGKLYQPQGVIEKMSHQNIPVIHLLNIINLMRKFEMPVNPVPLPPIGEGSIYSEIKYDVRIVWAFVIVLFALVLLMYFNDKKYYQLGKEKIMNEYLQNNKETEEEL